jgi:lipopolysaccharide exporter
MVTTIDSVGLVLNRTQPSILKRARDAWSAGRLTFFRDFAVLAGGQGASLILGFLVFTFLARTLQPEAYGVLEYVAACALFFASVADGGLGVAGVRRIAHQPGALPVLAAQVPLARLGLALISVPLMVLVAAPAHASPATRGLVWLFAMSLLAAPWRQDWLLQATERMREAALAQFLRMSVFAVVVFARVRSPADIGVVGWAEIAAATAMSAYCVAMQAATITPFRFRVPLTGIVAVAKEGALVGLGNSVWVAYQYAPVLLVTSLVNTVETAWVAAACRVIASLHVFSYLYHFNLYPTIARALRRDGDELAAILAASFRIVAWGGTLVALALTLLAAPLVVLLFGDRFRPAAPMLMVMAWTLPIALLSGHARWWLVASGMQVQVLSAQIAGVIGTVVTGVPLVLLGGGLGASWASVVGFVTAWIAAHAVARRHGSRLPPVTIALVPAGVAGFIVVAIHLIGINGWLAGLGLVCFSGAAPIVDRGLWLDLRRLGAARLQTFSGTDQPT